MVGDCAKYQTKLEPNATAPPAAKPMPRFTMLALLFARSKLGSPGNTVHSFVEYWHVDGILLKPATMSTTPAASDAPPTEAKTKGTLDRDACGASGSVAAAARPSDLSDEAAPAFA